MDLFVGGRVEVQQYPLAPKSYLLENKNGKFVDRSEVLNEEEGRLGMVTSAIWTDMNSDAQSDLIVVGEWMPIRVLINTNGQLIDKTSELGLSNLTGWWTQIEAADLDNDGDDDYVIGNYGLNSFYKTSPQKPLEIYARDFDLNGSIDPVVTMYSGDDRYMVHTLKVLTSQIPGMKNRFKTYSSYGEATFEMAFTNAELKDAKHLDCKVLSSIILENIGGSPLEVHDLPLDVQFSPIQAIEFYDLNSDQHLDIIMVGNSIHEETTTGFYDASYGNVLLNMGQFTWRSVAPSQSNFIANGYKKSLELIKMGNAPVLLVSENNGKLAGFNIQTSGK